MLFDLKPGDKVRFTNYLGEGTVFKIDGETIVVEDENGLLLHLTWKDVVPIFKPEKDLPVYRKESNVDLTERPVAKPSAPVAKNETPKEFDWDSEAKPKIKKVKDRGAGIQSKDSEVPSDIPQLHTDEDTGLPEIDLHLHELLEDESGMDDYDKLQYQLNILRREIKRLHQQRVREAVVIHGVGRGRLRDEVRTVLAESPGVADFFDASFKKYGAGATHIIFRG